MPLPTDANSTTRLLIAAREVANEACHILALSAGRTGDDRVAIVNREREVKVDGVRVQVVVTFNCLDD
jgi:hypothetical protein